ncbi:hypothetical protein OH77DRAFT_654571 [Trametes cingulata]|nr:hypothetical protein OH77DRAFT_654571 [Trametes cingulata]
MMRYSWHGLLFVAASTTACQTRVRRELGSFPPRCRTGGLLQLGPDAGGQWADWVSPEWRDGPSISGVSCSVPPDAQNGRDLGQVRAVRHGRQTDDA